MVDPKVVLESSMECPFLGIFFARKKNSQNKQTYFKMILQALLLVTKQQFICLFSVVLSSTLQSPLAAWLTCTSSRDPIFWFIMVYCCPSYVQYSEEQGKLGQNLWLWLRASFSCFNCFCKKPHLHVVHNSLQIYRCLKKFTLFPDD